MSLYAEYLRERTDDQILEIDEGFATYRFVDDNKGVYIVDIYIKPEARRYGHASKLADTISEIARKRGCTFMLGTVKPSAKGSTESLKALLAYGLCLSFSQVDGIVLRKELQ